MPIRTFYRHTVVYVVVCAISLVWIDPISTLARPRSRHGVARLMNCADGDRPGNACNSSGNMATTATASAQFALSLTTSSPAAASATQHRLAAIHHFSCSGTSGSLSPCSLSDSLQLNATNVPFDFVVSNATSITVNPGVSCTVVAPVTSCAVSPSSLTIPAHGEQSFTMTLTVSGAEGTGSVSVKSAGLNGTYTATVSIKTKKSPVVTPKGQQVSGKQNTAYTQKFAIANPSATSSNVVFTASCSRNLSCGSLSPPSPITLAAGATTPSPFRILRGSRDRPA